MRLHLDARLALSLFGLLALGLPSALGLSGCSGSSAGVGDPPAYDVSGTWAGSFVSQTGARGDATLKLTQQGNQVTGSVEATESCTGGGKLTATISGDSLSGSLTAGAVHATLDGTLASDAQIDGTYTLPAAGACADDSGSFHFTR